MSSWKQKYLGLIIEDRKTTTHALLERLADGESLCCRIVAGWQDEKNPDRLLINRVNIIIYAINFSKGKTVFLVECYLFGDLPLGLKPGKYRLEFNRFCTCDKLPDDMFETSDEVLISARELFSPNQLI